MFVNHVDGTRSQWRTPLTAKTAKMSGKLKVVDGSMVSVCDTYYRLLEHSVLRSCKSGC